MAELVRVEDHTEQALGLLIEAYRGLPRLTGLVASFTNRLQEFEDCNWDVLNKRLLDYTDRNGNPAHAVGAQLDVIGRIVQRGRNGQDDATYLIYIRAQIFLNKSKAGRDEVITLLQLVEAAAFTYTEFYPCTVLLAFVDALAASPLVLLDLAKRAVTGGVKLILTAPPPAVAASGVFTYSNFGDASVPGLGYGDAGGGSVGGVLASAYV
jgi:hypothetical protein